MESLSLIFNYGLAIEKLLILKYRCVSIPLAEKVFDPVYSNSHYLIQVIAVSLNPTPATSIPVSSKKTFYPAPFASLMEARSKRKLADRFEIENFGVNLTELAPGGMSALLHHHTKQDEFIYIVSGTPTLLINEQEYLLNPADCMGFKAGDGVAHQLINRTKELVVYLEIGDRTPGDEVNYPNNDLKGTQLEDGAWSFTHQDSCPY
ncbi:MAG: cupin domain-containing protein [Roseofilum sp. Belize BBD 4]|nr:cupin domain-containing protein [Roseofilum sp. Belize Diploria]MBP0032176.1 cupin domain-containing protein [Roseofilum sp. Belize BBD 4]HBR00609.1 cupin [Cyanobacteria bacterium UBA11691]